MLLVLQWAFQGQLALISKGGLPDSSKDGVTVAEAIFLEDQVEKFEEVVKESARKTVNRADGTTATCSYKAS